MASCGEGAAQHSTKARGWGEDAARTITRLPSHGDPPAQVRLKAHTKFAFLYFVASGSAGAAPADGLLKHDLRLRRLIGLSVVRHAGLSSHAGTAIHDACPDDPHTKAAGHATSVMNSNMKANSHVDMDVSIASVTKGIRDTVSIASSLICGARGRHNMALHLPSAGRAFG